MGKHETWVKEKVKMVAVCPWVVNTNLVQSAISTMGEAEKAKKTGSWVHRLIEPADVALAVEQAIVSGETGDVITVGPGVVYYYPDIQKMVFVLYKVIHTILVMVGGSPGLRQSPPGRLGQSLVFLSLAVGLSLSLIVELILASDSFG
eukprot:TRINITY_DN14240_c0_g1_i1.p1 TRINITY_DN14240_c0_g1~~TRINITY_DN14240_c0_g1_i1.p1  ORF type:complete len:160 (-),score=44.54 TRINITY_DN14240_c0_g1_i1:152-595(-)